MNKLNFVKSMGWSLDLALEAHELLRGATKREIPGVEEKKESYDNAEVTIVTILNETGEKMLGKPIGKYVTIEAPSIRFHDPAVHDEITAIFAKYLSDLLPLSPTDTVLVVGLGNWNATPDSLGPQVVDRTYVTRHLHQVAPEELPKGARPVCAISPGVLGITGIETAEIIIGVINHVKPAAIIAIDALAAGDVSRIATTIQLADTGITPGSGIGNNRKELSKKTLNIPVIAVGVPTIVHAGTIAFDAVNKVFDNLEDDQNFAKCLDSIPVDGIQKKISAVLDPYGSGLMVTPKDIDDLIDNTAKIIAKGMQSALFPTLKNSDIH